MYCRKCGYKNADQAKFCEGCGEAMKSSGQGGPVITIPNYLTQSILVTLFCCVPFGIVAIVNASRVNTRAMAGDVEGARDASENAYKWVIISLVCGLLVILINVALVFMDESRPQQ